MSKNTQALILFFASQLSWAVCCVASAPAFVVTTYAETPLQWGVMLNGIFITTASTFLMALAILVAFGSKKDELSPNRLDPKFSIGMGATAFLLIAQVVMAMGHAVWQPDEDAIVAPAVADVPVFEIWLTMDDGTETGGVNGFVIAHPDDERPIFVTVSQQFSQEYGLDRDLSVSEALGLIDSAVVLPIGNGARWTDEGEESRDTAIELGAPIRFEADAFLATGYGIQDSMSDVMFFEAPALAQYKLPTKVFASLDQAPTGQKLFVGEHPILDAEFSWDAEDVWEIELADSDEEAVPGTPVLNWEHEVVGWVTSSSYGSVDVFPMHLAFDYLGEAPLFR